MSDPISAALNYLGTQDTNQANLQIAQQNNAWSAAQYASRYQTMTQDMMKAGLNPMLAYSQSAGSSPTAQQVQFQNPVASATQAYHESAQRDVMRQDIEKSKVEMDKEKAETALKKVQAQLAEEQAKLTTAQQAKADQDARDAEGRANLAAVDLVRRGVSQSSQIEKNKADTSLSQQQVKTQGALAKTYISQLAVNKATIGNLVAMAARNSSEGALASARIREAVAKGEIAQADVLRAQNDMAYEKQTGGVARNFGRDLSQIGSARDSFNRRPYLKK